MKKITRNLRIILYAVAVLFVALSPLIHGLHLFLSSHSHNSCNVCLDNHSTHKHEKANDCHSDAPYVCSPSERESDKGHDPNTCELCRQFAQFLKTPAVLQSFIPVTLQDSLPEERTELPRFFLNTVFNNIIPRAPPAC